MTPSPLMPVDDVIELLLSRATPITDVLMRDISDCVGCTLATDVIAAINVPPCANSSMDGYAFDAEDAAMVNGAVVRISDRIAAGHVGRSLAPGTVARIFTGAPLPPGADTVIIQENTVTVDEQHVQLLQMPLRGDSVRAQGQDIAAGTVILTAGTLMRPQEAALVASVGLASVSVFRPLRIAIMSTGDELVEPPAALAPGQIYNANHYALIGLIRHLGMEVVDLGLVQDSRVATVAALTKGAQQADCIISTGGVSVGDEDHVKAALAEVGELDVWRIAIKPGKPLAFGRVADTPFFGLPGNPVSTFVTFQMIARPYLLKYQGRANVWPQALVAESMFAMPAGTRREYVRVRLSNEAGVMKVASFPNQGSGVMSSLVWANALAQVDVGQAVKVGDRVRVFQLEAF